MVWSSDGSTLSVLGGRSGDEVEVWDVAERKVLRQWKDDRAYGGLMMRRGPNHTAIGYVHISHFLHRIVCELTSADRAQVS